MAPAAPVPCRRAAGRGAPPARAGTRPKARPTSVVAGARKKHEAVHPIAPARGRSAGLERDQPAHQAGASADAERPAQRREQQALGQQLARRRLRRRRAPPARQLAAPRAPRARRRFVTLTHAITSTERPPPRIREQRRPNAPRDRLKRRGQPRSTPCPRRTGDARRRRAADRGELPRRLLALDPGRSRPIRSRWCPHAPPLRPVVLERRPRLGGGASTSRSLRHDADDG